MADFDQVATNEDIAAIANAIREVEGTTDDMTILEMPAKVRALQPSGNQDIETLDEYDVSHKATARVSAAERAKIVGSNIKQGVTILGVQGEYAQRNALPDLVSRTVTSFSAQDLDGATCIESRPFSHWSGLVSVEIPSSVEEIKSDAFYNCSGLSSVVIHEGLKKIGPTAFFGCSSLQTLVLPNSLTEISQAGLANVTGLRVLEIGTGIVTIGGQACRLSSSLQSITIRAVNPPTLQHYNAFDYTDNCPIYVPSGSVDAYKAAPNWSNLASRIQAIPS